jgi:hypothetical protein
MGESEEQRLDAELGRGLRGDEARGEKRKMRPLGVCGRGLARAYGLTFLGALFVTRDWNALAPRLASLARVTSTALRAMAALLVCASCTLMMMERTWGSSERSRSRSGCPDSKVAFRSLIDMMARFSCSGRSRKSWLRIVVVDE